MSHASLEDLREISSTVTKLNKKITSSIGLMIDTQGPEIRTSNFKTDVVIKKGDQVVLCEKLKDKNGKEILIDNLSYIKGLKVGGKISLDNGLIDLKIKKIVSGRIQCSALDAGVIAGKKHVNFPGAKIKLPTITAKDKAIKSTPSFTPSLISLLSLAVIVGSFILAPGKLTCFLPAMTPASRALH